MKKWWNKLMCKWFGHKPCFTIEYRYHCSGVKGRKHSYGFGGVMNRSNKGRWVKVGYEKCYRCGKKLSETTRIYGN